MDLFGSWVSDFADGVFRFIAVVALLLFAIGYFVKKTATPEQKGKAAAKGIEALVRSIFKK